MTEPDSGGRARRELMRYASVGVELAAAVVVGCLLGYWVDRRLDTLPWGLLTGAAIGVIGGLYNLIRPALKEAFRTAEEQKKRGTKRPDEKANSDDRRG